ncbi:MAG TPA: peptidase S10 [Thermodesulfobacteriota bacterium]|nr:peptidase S10 [Thermodesulfobacteriota bacterium]HNU70700.1 peptidase S10 [Thermodesulfobacteriota bacterium]
MKRTALQKVVLTFLAFVVFLFAADGSVWGEEQGDDRKKDNKNKATSPGEEQEQLSVTTHTMGIGKKELTYRATAGEILVELEKGAGKGRFFYVAYELESGEDAKRPITFAFNGGPGAAAVWLHLGGIGPQRVVLSEDGRPLPPPVQYADNPSTWLPFTDLVFIDPINTGFSRSIPEKSEAARKFLGVQQDIESVAAFIRLYLTRNNRWLSPAFLVGESYGTLRAAGLSGHLQERYGISLNGIVLISPVLDFSTISQQTSDDLSYLLYLPTYTATAWYHRLLSPPMSVSSLEQVLRSAEAFSMHEYALLLLKGDVISGEEQEKLLTALQTYTALSPELIRQNNYRVDWADFSLNLLGAPNRLVGRMDTTVTALNPAPDAPVPVFDPALDPLYGSFSSAMNAYVRDVLDFKTDQTYEFLNADVNRQWDWQSGIHHEQGFVDMSRSLRNAMAVNPDLNVYIACGIYDLATPYFAAVYTLNHMWLQERKEAVELKTYPAGHMLFLNKSVLEDFFRDIEAFYKKALRQKE